MQDPIMKSALRKYRWIGSALLISGLLMPVIAQQQSNSLSIVGKAGSARVVHVHGRGYVDVEDLARLLNATVQSNGSQIVLSASGENHEAAASPPGFSKGFVTAGIEAMAEQREWRAALKYAIEGGYPLTEAWLSTFRAKAQQALQIASVNATTDADKSAAPFLTTQFNNISQLSDKYLRMAVSMSYIDPKSLNNDALDQKFIGCGHSLSSMATANQFVDDGTCH